MNNQDKELLELYLHDIKKKRIIIITIVIISLIIIIAISKIYTDNIKQLNNTKNDIEIQEENSTNIVNEIIDNSNTIENTTSQSISETKEENEKNSQRNETVETQSTDDTITKQENKETSQTNSNSSNVKSETTNTSRKPSYKDFLFTDGYTMENVSQAAQDYLNSSGYAGECIPLQDDEGIYYGMRVIFY